jgi:hypothetical protein
VFWLQARRQKIEVQPTAGEKDFPVLRKIKTTSEAYRTLYQMNIDNFFSYCKVVEASSWPPQSSAEVKNLYSYSSTPTLLLSLNIN